MIYRKKNKIKKEVKMDTLKTKPNFDINNVIDKENLAKLEALNNKKVMQVVNEFVALCKPSKATNSLTTCITFLLFKASNFARFSLSITLLISKR